MAQPRDGQLAIAAIVASVVAVRAAFLMWRFAVARGLAVVLEQGESIRKIWIAMFAASAVYGTYAWDLTLTLFRRGDPARLPSRSPDHSRV